MAFIKSEEHNRLLGLWCQWNGQRGTEKQREQAAKILTVEALRRMLTERGVDVETHYIPAFSPRLGTTRELAICNAYVPSTTHALEPTCAACQQAIRDEEETAKALEAEFPEFSGKLVTTTTPFGVVIDK